MTTESGEGNSGTGMDASGRTGPPTGGVDPDQGSPVPPYEGRTTSAAEPDDVDEPEERKQRFAGAEPGSRTEEVSDPDQTPGGRTESPAEEQPAAETPSSKPSDPGVGPAHVPGTARAEDVADDSEAGREKTGTKGASDRPVGESSGRDVSSVKPPPDK